MIGMEVTDLQYAQYLELRGNKRDRAARQCAELLSTEVTWPLDKEQAFDTAKKAFPNGVDHGFQSVLARHFWEAGIAFAKNK